MTVTAHRVRWVRALVLSLLVVSVGVVGAAPVTATASLTSASQEGVTSVAATDAAITVSGTAPAGASVDVYALGSEQEPEAWSAEAPVTRTQVASDGSFSTSIARSEGMTELYYAKYVAVVDDEVIGTYRYVDQNEVTPKNSYPYPQALSKKGLQVQMTDDAEELGNQHAGINMPLGRLMQLEDEGPEKTITYVSNGREFYFDRAAVESSDRRIKPLSDNGQVVNLILLVYGTSDPNSAAQVLIHPDADSSGGPVFGFNTATAEGVAHYTAAVEFVAQRYTREDEAFGRATGFIVGNEIDAQWTWANMGEKSLDEFLLFYERALRITHRAAEAAYSGARTYTSLTHCWTTVCGANPDPDVQNRYYEGRDVIDGLNQLAKAHGDFGWHIAHHPYPENLFDPAFWEDTTATDDVETTPRITFKNIELLPEYLAREELTYAGEPRRVILSEQGCNTPKSSEEAERLQAACYALAYYKVRFLDGIDSFILHRHVDYKTEGGLRLGLWTWDDERPEQSSPGERKKVYDVFKYIDTERSLEVTDFALDVIGIDDWAELVPGWDPNALAQRPLPSMQGASTTTAPVDAESISSFEAGTDGWRTAENASSVTASDGALVVGFGALAKLWRGTDVELVKPIDATGSPYLGIDLEVPAQSETGTRFAKVRAYSGSDGQIAEGTARLADGGDLQRVVVDLSGWEGLDQITRLKVWVRGSTNADWAGEFRIGEVVLAERLAPAGLTTNLAFSATAPEGPEVGSPVEITVTNNDLRPTRAAVRVQACDGIELDPDSFSPARLDTGESRVFTGSILRYDPVDGAAPQLCLETQNAEYDIGLDVAPPAAESVYDFDEGTVQGWQAGTGVESVAAVQSFLNAPGTPHGGGYALDATAEVAPAADAKTVFVEPDQPLDLTEAAEVFVFLNSYGGVPDATDYEATFTLYSGADSVTVTESYSPDAWNEIVLPVDEWEGRSSVDRIEVGMRAVDSDLSSWNPHFQIDSLGFYDRPRA